MQSMLRFNYLVEIDRAPMPGLFHDHSETVDILRDHLNEVIPHYKPQVESVGLHQTFDEDRHHLEVSVIRDAVPGWNHMPEDMQRLLEAFLKVEVFQLFPENNYNGKSIVTYIGATIRDPKKDQ